MDHTRIPARFENKTLEGFEPRGNLSVEAAFNASYAMMERSSRTLVLLGPPGIGKTHLAAAVFSAERKLAREDRMREWQTFHDEWSDWSGRGGTWDSRPPDPLTQENEPLWVNVPSLLISMKHEMGLESYERDETRFGRTLAEYVGMVVFDDLGREKISEWAGEWLYSTLNTRYENQLRMMITSNLGIEELTDAGYWPIISRLAEDGTIVIIDAPDYRLQ